MACPHPTPVPCLFFFFNLKAAAHGLLTCRGLGKQEVMQSLGELAWVPRDLHRGGTGSQDGGAWGTLAAALRLGQGGASECAHSPALLESEVGMVGVCATLVYDVVWGTDCPGDSCVYTVESGQPI